MIEKGKENSRGQKRFRVLNVSLNILIIAFLIALAIYYFISNNTANRQYACLGLVGFSFIPFIFEWISRRQIPNYLYFFVNIYNIFAGVWGSALSAYTTYWWFDIVIHTFMGYFAGAVGLFFLCNLDDQKKMRMISVALFCLSFSLLIEGVWELFEFAIDLIAPSMQMQGINYVGENFPLVTDTMVDILCNFIGALVFFIHYILEKTTKRKLGIDSMIKEFSSTKRKSVVSKNNKTNLKNHE